MLHPKGLTKDSFETHFGVNYAAHFALFQALRETLIKSAGPSMSSRVVMLASLSHQASSVNFEDINFTTRDYSPMLAYGVSKTACIWMANEIERRYGREGLHATSVHPGAIHTEVARHNPSGDAMMLKPEMRRAPNKVLPQRFGLPSESDGKVAGAGISPKYKRRSH